MANLLEVRDAHKRYGDQVLLDGAGVVITGAHKVGLIGRNGCGKSTLCRVFLGEEELDSGEVLFHPNLRLGYLRQHDPFEPDETVLDFLLRESQQPDWRCGEVAAQFEIRGERLNQKVDELSGGWKTRVKLAGLLLDDPNLLLLDEPTNFLDLRTQLLLEDFLRSFRGACLVVSHDRAFLKATCERTLELARGQLTMFPGDVDVYLEQQQQRIEHDQRVNASVMAKRKQLETFINKNRANANTASQARSKAKQLERLELTEIDGPESNVRIRLPQVEARKGPALRCKDLTIGYPDFQVAEGVNVEVDHGSRTAIVGDNGQGKTTFLRSITDSLEPLEGSLRWGHGCEIGVYAQHVYTSLPEDQTVHQYLEYCASPETKAQTVLDVAGSFLFRGEIVNKKVGVLSGGERARLCMAGLLLGRHNILVMDEPGNHLDVETVEALADAMEEFAGTIVFTSHDRYFMHRVATTVVEVRDGRVATYPGKYDDYVYRVSKEISDGARERSAQSAGSSKNGGVKPQSKSNKIDGRRRYELQKEIASLERQIASQEKRREEFEAQLLEVRSNAEAQNIRNTIAAVAEKLAPLEAQWLQAQEELGEG